MKDIKKIRIKSLISYLSTIITWSFFIILLSCALFLGYYYISLKLYSTKGEKYKPAFSIYTIVSPSMTPNINVYDIVINFKVDSPLDIKEGDVITFISDGLSTQGMTITHRVKSIQVVNGKYQYVTKGDNNVVEDSAPASYNKIIGKTVVRLPQLGRIQFFIASKTGWIFVVVVPSIIIILNDILKIIRLSKVKKEAEISNKSLNNRISDINDNLDN